MKSNLTPFIKPQEILNEDENKYLKKKDDFKGISLIIHAWVVIFICSSLGILGFIHFLFFQ